MIEGLWLLHLPQPMHVIDAVLDSFTRLFRHHSYSPLEKLYSMGIGESGNNLLPLRPSEIETKETCFSTQRQQLEDSEEHRGDSNSGSNCA